jgi:hypothetical protein
MGGKRIGVPKAIIVAVLIGIVATAAVVSIILLHYTAQKRAQLVLNNFSL